MFSQPNRFDVSRLVVLLAGSRSGSSFLFRMLSSQTDFLSPTGEETPFYRLAGIGKLTGPHSSDILAQRPSSAQLDLAADLLLKDCGPQTFADAILQRTELQWPQFFKATETHRCWLDKELKGLPADFSNWREFYFLWLNFLRQSGLPIDLAAYSTVPSNLEFPLLEDPPYIIPEPKVPLSKQRLEQCPLLLKTSSNVFHPELLPQLFPRAQISWVVLHRNPAASISALYDGWLSGGFHSHDLRAITPLSIEGYSDVMAYGDRYWKFDLPPSWIEYTRSTLMEVCTFQWIAAQKAMQNFLETNNDRKMTVQYESLLDPHTRSMVLRDILQFAQVAPSESGQIKANEEIMTVSPPAKGKWQKRNREILATLNGERSSELRELSECLQYDWQKQATWP